MNLLRVYVKTHVGTSLEVSWSIRMNDWSVQNSLALAYVLCLPLSLRPHFGVADGVTPDMSELQLSSFMNKSLRSCKGSESLKDVRACDG